MSILIAIPAAGASSRMGDRDKLLEPVDGQPLLRRQTMAGLATGEDVVVLLPSGSVRRRDALRGLEVRIEDVPDASEGLSASLRRAARLGVQHDGLAILLPDVPGVGLPEISAVLQMYRENSAANADTPTVVRATDPQGRPGTPIVFPPTLLAAFDTLKGDTGARELLKGRDILSVTFQDDRATRDLDTPEDWALWHAERRASV